ncbi:MAG: signal peptidase I [Acidimicrobiia bacterium]
MTSVRLPRCAIRPAQRDGLHNDLGEGRGRHLSERGWPVRVDRLRPALFAQCALLAMVAALVWPASLGGAFGIVAIAGRSMEPTHQLGDVVITWKQPVAVGDVILYRVPAGAAGAGNPVIHRVVGGDPGGWVTQGDNVSLPDPWRPSASDVLGVAEFGLPLDAGVIALLRSWWFVAVTGGIAVALLLWPESKDPDRSTRGRHRHPRHSPSRSVGR